MWGIPISTVRTASKPALHCSRTKVRCAAMLGFSLQDSRSERSVIIRNTDMLNNYEISCLQMNLIRRCREIKSAGRFLFRDSDVS